MNKDDVIINWLLDGDPSIRYQTLRDLTDASDSEVAREQKRIFSEGWGADLLARQDEIGTWGNGCYSPKWISTTYTLLLLRRLGMPTNAQVKMGGIVLMSEGFYEDNGINFSYSMDHSETCVTGMVLSILSFFGPVTPNVKKLVEHLLEQQMDDGGWNCRSYDGDRHSSFHTTINVLEGLHEARQCMEVFENDITESIKRGMEFLLQHKLFRSHRTGEIVDSKMTRFAFPPRWRYDVMRALDFAREINMDRDPRFEDAIALLKKKRTKEGVWKLQNRYPGKTFFEMEEPGKPSRWNTLRALRILDWWECN